MKHSKKVSLFIAVAVLVMVSCVCPNSLNPLSGVQETVGAIASQMPEGALETIQAVGTQMPPGAAETAMAAITQAVGSGIIETAQGALADSGMEGILTPGAPSDIPTYTGDKTVIVENEGFAQYTSNDPFSNIVNFYLDSMPASGWEYEESDSSLSSNTASLIFKKDARLTTIGIIDLTVSRSITVETHTQ
jgi:hypothetical protein